MEVLVTGGTGLLGNNVVRHLLAQGHQVHVLVRSQTAARALDGLRVTQHPGEIESLESLRQAARNVSHIVHAAASVHIGWKGLEQQRKINVAGTRNVAQVALEYKARLVHVSSVNSLGLTGTEEPADEETPYGPVNIPTTYVVTKREADDAIRQFCEQGLDAVLVHPGFMLGPWDWKPSSGKMILEVAHSAPVVAPRGGCSLCDVRDVAAGVTAALEKGTTGESYILAGWNITYLQLWRDFSRVIGSIWPWCRMGPMIATTAGAVGDLVGLITGREPVINSGAIRMSRQYHYYSSAKAEKQLGYHFRPGLDTIRDAWMWFNEHGYVRRPLRKAVDS